MPVFVEQVLDKVSARTEAISSPIASTDHHVNNRACTWAILEASVHVIELSPYVFAEAYPIKVIQFILMAKDLAKKNFPQAFGVLVRIAIGRAVSKDIISIAITKVQCRCD